MAAWYDPFGMFSNPENPADDAMQYLQEIPGTITPYYNPYIGAGQNALSTLQGQSTQLMSGLPSLQNNYNSLMGMGPTVQNEYMRMITDPTYAMNQIGAGYQQSPGYQYQVDQSLAAANRAAAASGMLGSPEEQAYMANTANQLANQDYYNYVTRGLNQYNTGVKGASNLYGMGLSGTQGLYNTGLGVTSDLNKYGYMASNELANSLANNLSSQANLQYGGASNVNAANSAKMGGMMGAGASLLPYLFL